MKFGLGISNKFHQRILIIYVQMLFWSVKKVALNEILIVEILHEELPQTPCNRTTPNIGASDFSF